MANYAIGDVQGCLYELEDLLKTIHYTSADQLWFAGDLVNRGPHSLEVLQLIDSLQPTPKIVLGNHDFHLMALIEGCGRMHKGDTLDAILKHPRRDYWYEWLSAQALMIHEPLLQTVMVHAGVYPLWSVSEAKAHAATISACLLSAKRSELIHQLYGNEPALWSEGLQLWPRYRFIINAFTRMRFCSVGGLLDLKESNATHPEPEQYYPWFALPQRLSCEEQIIFGHWAALQGQTDTPKIEALDTGCVWGGCLTALCLETGERFSVPARQNTSN
jgi:bis(5'-nucleosyl)-tetraphosphatase (symmetrical)